MNKTKKEIIRFLFAGLSAVATDLFVYSLLLKYLPPSVSKGISFISGTVTAYFLNKYWTFEKNEAVYPSEIAKFILLYSATLVINVVINKISLSVLPTQILLAFLAATGTSTILNFVGQKWWVFK